MAVRSKKAERSQDVPGGQPGVEDPAEDLSAFCRHGPTCPDHGKRGAGNLSVCDRSGKHGQYRMLYCRTCKARFSERKGTVFFRARTPEQKLVSIPSHVQEGVGMRKTGRLLGVKEDTVIRPSTTLRVYDSYNFRWAVRTLAVKPVKGKGGASVPRTPAMSAGLADHVWTLAEWLALPAVNRSA